MGSFSDYYSVVVLYIFYTKQLPVTISCHINYLLIKYGFNLALLLYFVLYTSDESQMWFTF